MSLRRTHMGVKKDKQILQLSGEDFFVHGEGYLEESMKVQLGDRDK